MKKKKHAGFSLIELLVVIGIIAILASLILGYITASMEAARTQTCVNNMRQWGAALQTYAAENNNRFPTEGVGSQSVDIFDEDAWFNVLADFVDVVPLIENYTTTGEVPRPGDATVYSCPTVRKSDLPSNFPPGKPWIAYAQNLYIEEPISNVRRADPKAYGYLLSIDDVPNPSTFAYLGEVDGGKYANCDARHLAGRHKGRQKKTNILFVDSRVQTFPISQVRGDLRFNSPRSQNVGGITWDPTAPVLD